MSMEKVNVALERKVKARLDRVRPVGELSYSRLIDIILDIAEAYARDVGGLRGNVLAWLVSEDAERDWESGGRERQEAVVAEEMREAFTKALVEHRRRRVPGAKRVGAGRARGRRER